MKRFLAWLRSLFSKKAPVLTPQTSFFYGYYGSVIGQLEVTKDHTNVAFVANWPDAGIQTEQLEAIKDAGLKAIWMPVDNSEAGLINQLTNWQTLGLLESIVAVYWDEPDRNGSPNMTMVRHVLSLFSGTANVKLSASFSTAQDTPQIESYDWVGVSAYAQGEGALKGEIQTLRAKLAPDQKLIIFSYGADPWRQNPKPFWDYALSDNKVVALLYFVFFSHDGTDFGQGIGVNGMLPLYRGLKK